MRPIRFRHLLPVVFGCLAVALIAWELHNQLVISAMGMAWDTGPPIWPYQTSWILLQSINAPACALALSLLTLFGVRTIQTVLLVEFPFILAWWWFVGWRIDFGLLPKRNVHSDKLWATVLGVTSIVFLGTIVYLIAEQERFWFQYRSFGWRGPVLFAVRNSGILCWCLILGTWSTAATVRLLAPSSGQDNKA
jgi:hypothetical protein